MMNFPRGKKYASKMAVLMSSKGASTSTSTNDFSQNLSCNESDMFLKPLGQQKALSMKSKR